MKIIVKIYLLLFMLISHATVSAQSEAAAKQYNKGVEELEKEKYDLAIKYFTEAIKLEPGFKFAFDQRGRAYVGKELYEEAISDFTEVIRLDPTYFMGYNDRGYTYNQVKKYDLAIEDLTQAIRIDPLAENAYYNRSEALFNKGLYDEEIDDLTTAIKINPKDIYYNQRGYAYFKKDQIDLAITDYTEAIRLDPKYELCYHNRAAAYFKQKKYDLEIADYTKAIELNPRKELYYNNRGYAYFLTDEYSKAIADFTSAINLNPSFDIAFRNRADAYEFARQYDNAFTDYAEAIRLNPKSYQAFIGRGQLYKYTGQYELAIRDYNTTIQIKPDHGIAYTNIISPLIRTEQFLKAKEYYTRYKDLKLSDNIDNIKENEFYIYYIKAGTEDIPNKNYEQALANLNVAVAGYGTEIRSNLRSRYSNILALKGYVLEKLNRFIEAKDIYEKALMLNPNQPDIKQGLAKVNKRLTEVVLTDKIPPVIELLSPEPSRSFTIESENGATQLTGRAKDESGIANIKINGKDIDKVEEDGFFMTNLPLQPGANSIVIIATDKQGNTATKTFTITGAAVVKKKEPDIPVLNEVTPKYYAILIAEKDYQDPAIPNLQNPVKDARELKNILVSQYTFDAGNIDTLYNRSREEIMQTIIQRCNTLTANDNLVIFYAGHGTAEKDRFGDVDGYWIPVSAKKGMTASYISAADINTSLKRSNAKHILLIADACFSGAFTRQLPGGADPGIQKQYKVPSRKVMASGNMEPVPDNSRFLYYLKKSLKENTEKFISAKDVFDSFYKALLNNTDNLPQYAAIKNVGDEGGEFVFIKK